MEVYTESHGGILTTNQLEQKNLLYHLMTDLYAILTHRRNDNGKT